ncbi:MAG: hypothetical protein FWF22_03360 [Treponema sp.]|nr:hypothetical protein [Treponema sp.]
MKKVKISIISLMITASLLLAGCDNPAVQQIIDNFVKSGDSGTAQVTFNSKVETIGQHTVITGEETTTFNGVYEFDNPDLDNDLLIGLTIQSDKDGYYVMLPSNASLEWTGNYKYKTDTFPGNDTFPNGGPKEGDLVDSDALKTLDGNPTDGLFVTLQIGVDNSLDHYKFADGDPYNTGILFAGDPLVTGSEAEGFFYSNGITGQSSTPTGYTDNDGNFYSLSEIANYSNDGIGYFKLVGTGVFDKDYTGKYLDDEGNYVSTESPNILEGSGDNAILKLFTGYAQITNGEYETKDGSSLPADFDITNVQGNETDGFYYIEQGYQYTDSDVLSQVKISSSKNVTLPSTDSYYLTYGNDTFPFTVKTDNNAGKTANFVFATDGLINNGSFSYSTDGITWVSAGASNVIDVSKFSAGTDKNYTVYVKAQVYEYTESRIDLQPVMVDDPTKPQYQSIAVHEEFTKGAEQTEKVYFVAQYDNTYGDVPVYAVYKDDPLYDTFLVIMDMKTVGGESERTGVHVKTVTTPVYETEDYVIDTKIVTHQDYNLYDTVNAYKQSFKIGTFAIDTDLDNDTITVTFSIYDDIPLTAKITLAHSADSSSFSSDDFTEVQNNQVTFDYEPGTPVYVEARYSFL